jgi:hypothetical protein
MASGDERQLLTVCAGDGGVCQPLSDSDCLLDFRLGIIPWQPYCEVATI